MRLEYSDDQVALRAELRDYFAAMRSGAFADLQREDHGPRYRDWMRQLGADGWLGIGWPTEYGGQGRPYLDQFIFFDEAMRCGVPIPMISLNTVGPTLMRHGSEEQRHEFLPRILRGEIDFAVGYSEPDAGTDLASLVTHAVRDGDHYVVNGSKVFTSRGGSADYVWLAARTDPGTSDHRGLSVLIVDTADPGYSSTPTHTLASYATYSTFYDDVRVPVTRRVGEENDGWRLVTTQLNYERVAMASFAGPAHTIYADVLAWTRTTYRDGRLLIETPWVQVALARCHVLLSALEILVMRASTFVGDGVLSAADASTVKVLSTESVGTVYRLLMEVVGVDAALRDGDRWAALEFAYRRAVINTFGGGTNEIQRDIIAQDGLGLPRSARR
jgi:3-oxocholest-4-en-26-oyl-CoA dehydrogenase alpha subunit